MNVLVDGGHFCEEMGAWFSKSAYGNVTQMGLIILSYFFFFFFMVTYFDKHANAVHWSKL